VAASNSAGAAAHYSTWPTAAVLACGTQQWVFVVLRCFPADTVVSAGMLQHVAGTQLACFSDHWMACNCTSSSCLCLVLSPQHCHGMHPMHIEAVGKSKCFFFGPVAAWLLPSVCNTLGSCRTLAL
jgi:hypothetical protein